MQLKPSIIEKKGNEVKYLTQDSISPSCQTLSKALDRSSATAQVAPDLLKVLAIQSDTTVKRLTVVREYLKQYQKSEKGHIFLGDEQAYYLQVS